MKNFKVSVTIPAFNEEDNLKELHKQLLPVLERQPDYEILFVDDGSTDNTSRILKELRDQNPKIKYLSLSRSFGHQCALKAGLDHANGDCIVSIDADLQHPAELILEMIKKWQEGYDIVYTIRKEHPDTPFLKRKTAALFYKLINKISDIKLDRGAADFRLLDRRVVNEIKKSNEAFLFIRGMISWVGFKQYGIEYIPQKRFSGKSKYSIKTMSLLALDGITSYSVKPLRISTILGSLASLLAFIYMIYAISMAIFTDKAISGWASIIVSVLFMGGILLLMLGIMGEYLGKIFMELKNRPNYIVKERSKD